MLLGPSDWELVKHIQDSLSLQKYITYTKAQHCLLAHVAGVLPGSGYTL